MKFLWNFIKEQKSSQYWEPKYFGVGVVVLLCFIKLILFGLGSAFFFLKAFCVNYYLQKALCSHHGAIDFYASIVARSCWHSERRHPLENNWRWLSSLGHTEVPPGNHIPKRQPHASHREISNEKLSLTQKSRGKEPLTRLKESLGRLPCALG